MENNLTNGSVLKTLVLFSMPFLLSYFLQTLYGMADLYIIGLYDGVASTTAVAVGSQVMHMITVMLVGITMGSTVMIGRAVGARDRKEASEAVGNTITLFVIIAAALTVLLLIFVNQVVGIMSTPAEAVSGTRIYLIVCFAGIPFITAYNIISAIFRGLGDSKSPMYFVIVACVFNIGLDFLFIGAFDMGPSGAAFGTIVAQAISVLFAIMLIRRKGAFNLTRDSLRIRKNMMLNILKVGIPVSFQDGFIQISFLVITVIANQRGLNDAAAVGIVEKIISILFIVSSSMLASVSAISAQNIGAGKPDRARATLKYAMIIACSFGFMCLVLMQFFAAETVGLFTDSNEVIILGDQYMRGYSIDCLFAAVHFCFSGYFCACGWSIVSFIHNAISIVFGRIPLAYLASINFPDTLLPMGLATTTGSLLSVFICMGVYIWMRRRGCDIIYKS